MNGILFGDGSVCNLHFTIRIDGTMSVERVKFHGPLSRSSLGPYEYFVEAAVATEIVAAFYRFADALVQRVEHINSVRNAAFRAAKHPAKATITGVTPTNLSIAQEELDAGKFDQCERLRPLRVLSQAVPARESLVVKLKVHQAEMIKRQKEDDEDSETPRRKFFKTIETTVSKEVRRRSQAAFP